MFEVVTGEKLLSDNYLLENPNQVAMDIMIEQKVAKCAPKDIDAGEVAEITRVLKSTIKYSSNDRPTADDLLEDDWFKNLQKIPPSLSKEDHLSQQ